MVEGPVVSLDTQAARDEILERIRSALSDVPPNESPSDVPVPREFRTVDPAPRAELVDRFVDRVAEYKATVHRVEPDALIGAIAEACAKRKVERLVIPADVPEAWVPSGITILRDPGLSVAQLETANGVLTACALGIAQTGTIVLDSGPGQGRRILTLLPDYHLCIVRADQIVGLVPEAVAALADSARSPARPITFISGPSATSDIELDRVEGVHGPRTLEVIVVESEPH
jgi:L-lactate dehydrogenase complex protein LldG